MTAKHLLDELETLPSHARIRRMVELGRSVAHDPDVAVTLTALEQGDFYERFLALHACFGSYDGAHVLRALTDSSRIIRGVAIHLSVLACNEEQLRQALTLVPRDGRLPPLWKLYHHGYETLIDAFLEQLAENHDLQLRQLLPCGSPPLIRRFLERFQHCMELVDWRRLAQRHPLLACELLQARAAAAPSLDVQLVAFVNGVLPVLATKQPDQALLLVKTLAQTVPLNRLDLDALLLQRPAEVVGLALQGEDLGELAFYRVAHKLDKERLLALIETHVTVWEYHHLWLPALKPEARLALYASFASSWRDQRGCLTPDLIALLPQDQREQEGRRHLALDALATRPEERLRYAAFLPWDGALYLLDPFLHDPSEKVRSLALQALMRAVCYQRGHLSDVLALICEHLNEPDPVRGHMINQLAELPRGIWTSEHLEGLEQIIQGVINAFDTSSFTLGALSLLITRLLTCAPEWSATQLALVVQKHGLTFNYGCMENRLSEAEVRQIGLTLRPVLLSWTEREDKGNLAETIRLFGRQVRAFDALMDALELALSHKPDFSLGNEILLTIIKYRSERAAQLIPELMQSHRDWITYPAVSHYLHHHRQDLLTPLLKYRKYSDVFRDTQNRTFTYRRSSPGDLHVGPLANNPCLPARCSG